MYGLFSWVVVFIFVPLCVVLGGIASATAHLFLDVQGVETFLLGSFILALFGTFSSVPWPVP